MSTTLDAGEDRLIVDAFDRACAAYPRAYGGDAIVDGVAAGSDDSDDTLLGGAAPAEPPAAALAMPPAEGFVPPAGAPAAAPPAAAVAAPPPTPADAATPVGLPTPPLGDTYGDLLRSWYYAGYYSGLHEARQRAAAAARSD